MYSFSQLHSCRVPRDDLSLIAAFQVARDTCGNCRWPQFFLQILLAFVVALTSGLLIRLRSCQRLWHWQPIENIKRITKEWFSYKWWLLEKFKASYQCCIMLKCEERNYQGWLCIWCVLVRAYVMTLRYLCRKVSRPSVSFNAAYIVHELNACTMNTCICWWNVFAVNF